MALLTRGRTFFTACTWAITLGDHCVARQLMPALLGRFAGTDALSEGALVMVLSCKAGSTGPVENHDKPGIKAVAFWEVGDSSASGPIA